MRFSLSSWGLGSTHEIDSHMGTGLVGPSDAHNHRPDAMVSSDPLQPPRLVGEVLGTDQLPNELVEALSDWV